MKAMEERWPRGRHILGGAAPAAKAKAKARGGGLETFRAVKEVLDNHPLPRDDVRARPE